MSNLINGTISGLDFDRRPDAEASIGTGFEKDNANPAYAEYTVSFHEPGRPGRPIVLEGLALTLKDIDELQYVAVTGASSYLLSSTPATNLDARTVGNVLYVEELNSVTSDTEDQDHWAVINFTSKSSITIRLGNDDDNSFYAQFNALFAGVDWEASPTSVVLEHPVTFDANGGTGTMIVQSESSATSLTANAFTRAGYSFAGWNTEEDGTGTSYADGASYPFTSSVTLFAQWSPNTGLAVTGANDTGLNGVLAIAGVLSAVGIAAKVVRRRRATS